MKIDPFPSRIVLELTPLCNLACHMCPRHYVQANDGFMDAELFRKLIDEIHEENPQAVVLPFWRGESCLHPKFGELMEYAFSKNMRVHLSTNGLFMDPSIIDVFQKCEFLTFSIHNNQGYRNALKFIGSKSASSKVTTQISFVDSEKTCLKYLEECTADNSLKGFDSIRLYVEHTVGGEFGKNVHQPRTERRFCPKLENSFVVSASGTFSRCNHIWLPESGLNLSSATIKQVWVGERMNEIRSTYPDTSCTPCDQWSGHTNGEGWHKDSQGEVEHVVYGS